jgi:hypothetical protein
MMTIEEYKAAAEGFYRGAVLVADFMQELSSNLLGTLINVSNREENTMGMFLRAKAWMLTLKKLNNPVAFQAIVSCNRALLEIAVDMILLHHDKTDASWWKMQCWEQSAILKVSEQLKAYFDRRNVKVPARYNPQLDFIRDNKTLIEAQRLNLWGKKNHPMRWTGNNLLHDSELADQYWGTAIKEEIGTTLIEFYETEYRRMNLNVHGSALAAIRYAPGKDFHITCGLTFKSCAELGALCTKVILDDYDFAAHYPELSNRWEELSRQRNLVYEDARGLIDS